VVSGDSEGFEVVHLSPSDFLYGVWVAPSGTVIATGWTGLLLFGGADGFENWETDTSNVLNAIMGVDENDYFVAGRKGTLLRYRVQ